ncbi:ATP-binding cassette domain-containing protein [Sutcliffiella halmapala]|uniref:ATP-binding cassette domain-containing protein n=1 Tax=Sutcliffiella halmapala TaxID=79882 RepID=UPI0009954CFF|nr:ATP-binding cassette domain-containing protein [Sutcliffiella halmapala]
MKDVLISVNDLKKSYGNNAVLSGLTFEVERGSIFALLGENGAGKTTTVRILSTLIKADAGKATIAGFDSTKDAGAIRKLISLTGQYAAVDELLTGEENLQMMARLHHFDRKTVKQRTEELLTQFDLVDAAKRQAKTYSGGMRRRLDIAISLIGSPKIIFLDEPTTGLDPRSRMNMWELIKELARSGVTIFLTTQYLDEADQLADKIAVINAGKIVAEGTAEELKGLVGEEKIELSFQNQADLELAQVYLDGHVDEKQLKIAITADGSTASLRHLLNDLYTHGIEPTAIHYRKPTLDDVFLEMTSKQKKGVVLL